MSVQYSEWALYPYCEFNPIQNSAYILVEVSVYMGAAVVKWLSSWFMKQEILSSNPGIPPTNSEIGYILLPSRNMPEIQLKATLILNTTNNQVFIYMNIYHLLYKYMYHHKCIWQNCKRDIS